jgi:hypothetical protein
MTAPTLTEFLLARIAEDEEVARAASPASWTQGVKRAGSPGRWHGIEAYSVLVDRSDRVFTEGAPLVADSPSVSDVEHIARHDPARVLAECEAKRRIVAMGQFSDSPESAVDFWLEVGEGKTPPQPVGALVDVFRALALPYADHPDFREEWRRP